MYTKYLLWYLVVITLIKIFVSMHTISTTEKYPRFQETKTRSVDVFALGVRIIFLFILAYLLAKG